MLFKNHQPYTPTDKEKAAFEKAISTCTWPLTFQYSSNRVRPSRERDDKGNRQRDDMPRSIALQPHYTAADEQTGSVEFRYAKSKQPSPAQGGNPRYLPHALSIISNQLVVKKEDWDLAYFMLSHPKCENGINPKKTNPSFKLEQKAITATMVADRERLEARFRTLIYDEDLGLTEPELRDIAIAYNINQVSILTPDQIRAQLKMKVADSHKRDVTRIASIQEFLETTGSKEKIKLRGTVQRASELDLIGIHPVKKQWMWKDENGEWAGVITKLVNNKTSHKSMYDYLDTPRGQKTYTELKQAVKELQVLA